MTVTATNPAGRELDAVENQVRNVQMLADLAAWPSAGVLPSVSWDVRTGTWFEPGFAVETATAEAREALLALGRRHGQLAVYEYAYDDKADHLRRSVVACDATAAADTEVVPVGPVPRPGPRHPVYGYPDWTHLYHRAGHVRAFFRRVRTRTSRSCTGKGHGPRASRASRGRGGGGGRACACGSVYYKQKLDATLAASTEGGALGPLLERIADVAASGRAAMTPPLIVVEGLDGCGKSTLVKSLVARLGARAAVTPPPSMAPLRPVRGGSHA